MEKQVENVNTLYLEFCKLFNNNFNSQLKVVAMLAFGYNMDFLTRLIEQFKKLNALDNKNEKKIIWKERYKQFILSVNNLDGGNVTPIALETAIYFQSTKSQNVLSVKQLNVKKDYTNVWEKVKDARVIQSVNFDNIVSYRTDVCDSSVTNCLKDASVCEILCAVGDTETTNFLVQANSIQANNEYCLIVKTMQKCQNENKLNGFSHFYEYINEESRGIYDYYFVEHEKFSILELAFCKNFVCYFKNNKSECTKITPNINISMLYTTPKEYQGCWIRCIFFAQVFEQTIDYLSNVFSSNYDFIKKLVSNDKFVVAEVYFRGNKGLDYLKTIDSHDGVHSIVFFSNCKLLYLKCKNKAVVYSNILKFYFCTLENKLIFTIDSIDDLKKLHHYHTLVVQFLNKSNLRMTGDEMSTPLSCLSGSDPVRSISKYKNVFKPLTEAGLYVKENTKNFEHTPISAQSLKTDSEHVVYELKDCRDYRIIGAGAICGGKNVHPLTISNSAII